LKATLRTSPRDGILSVWRLCVAVFSSRTVEFDPPAASRCPRGLYVTLVIAPLLSAIVVGAALRAVLQRKMRSTLPEARTRPLGSNATLYNGPFARSGRPIG